MSDEPRKLSHYFASSKRKGRAGLPLMSVTMHDGLVRRDTLDRKTDSALRDEEHLLVEPGDIAYNMMRMWQGALGLADEAANVSPAYGVMRPKNTVDPRFAKHWFKSDRGLYMLWAYSYGLTEDRLRLYPAEFLRIPVSWPSRHEQNALADALDAWDAAVSDASKILRRLEELRFKQLENLLANTSTVRVGDLFNVIMGQSPPSSSYLETSAPQAEPFVGGAADFGEDGYVHPQVWTTEPHKSTRKPSLIMSVRAPVGSFAKALAPVCIGRGVCALTPKAFKSLDLGAFALSRLESYWYRIKQGGTFESVNRDDIINAPVPDFRQLDIQRLSQLAEAEENLIFVQKNLVAKLRVQKKALLQKIFGNVQASALVTG